MPQVFLVNPDGTTTELSSDGLIKDILKTDECYVLVADDVRKVFLWKGLKSSVRSKFIGAKRSQIIQLVTYIQPIDYLKFRSVKFLS